MSHVLTLTVLSTANGGPLAGSVIDFPTLFVPVDDATDSDYTDFWATVQNGGADLRFYDDGGVTEFAREMVDCDTTAKDGEIWFKRDLSMFSDNVTEVHADGVSSDYTSGAYAADQVWADYAFVSHDGGATESSGAGGTRTDYGSVSPGTATGGMGSATVFDGVDDMIGWGDIADIGAADHVVSAWIDPDTYGKQITGGDRYGRIIRKGSDYDFMIADDPSANVEEGIWLVSGVATEFVITLNASNFVAARYDHSATDAFSYINGAFGETGSSASTGAANSESLCIGNYDTAATYDRYFNGHIWELRLRNANVDNYNTAWHAAEYANQSDPATFYTVSAVGGGSAVAADDLAQAQMIDSVTITQHNVISPASMSQGQSLDAAAITQTHIVSPAGIDQAQSIESPTLTQAHIIVPAGLVQAQIIEPVTITQAHVVSPADIGQAVTLDQAVITVAGSIAPQNMSQAQLLDALTIVQRHVIAPADIAQAQQVDSTAVSESALTVTPAGLGQAQSLDSTALTQYHVITPSDLTQQQLIDIVTLGGLVIGELQGQVVVYAAIDGKIMSIPALAGTIH